MLAAALLAAITSGAAAQPARIARVGIVFNSTPVAELTSVAAGDAQATAFREGLREYGWIEGRNLEIHWRSAEQQPARRPGLIAELVRLPVDVLLVGGNFATEEALRITTRTPIVMLSSYAPVDSKLIASAARPGGNVTGLASVMGRDLHGKRLELLKQAAPKISKVAFLVPNYGKPETSIDFAPETFAAARSLGLAMFHQRFEGIDDLPQAVEEAVRQGANALFVGEWAAFVPTKNQVTIHRLVERHRLPAIYTVSGSAESGGLIFYGADLAANYRRAGYYVDKILRGAKPGEIPIEQPKKLDLILNVKAAKAIGLTFPAALIAQADRVIE